MSKSLYRLTVLLLAGFALGLVGCQADSAADSEDSASTPTLTDQELEERAAASREAAKKLGGQLKQRLQAAIQEQGPPAAIGVCQDIAPSMAQQVSQDTGWEVARTALRVRNPDNQPDAWERQAMKDFQDRNAGGESYKGMQHYEVVSEGGEARFRYLMAIPTQGVCLTCHGETIDPAVEQAIEAAYPNDQARGFEVGDLRGAFTVTQSL